MKILLVGNYLPDKQESMLRFNKLLFETLQSSGHQVKLIRPSVIFNRSQSSFEEKGKWWGYIDKFILFPIRLHSAIRDADVVHICDHSNAPYIHFIHWRPHVINCHDVIAIRASLDPDNRTQKRSGKILQNMILQGLKKAEKFACISQNSRRELLEVTGVSPDKVTVIYMGINYPFEKIEDSKAREKLLALDGELAASFVLHVGGNQPYKNRMGVLRIYRQLLEMAEVPLPKLALAGKAWSDEMRSYIAANGLQDSVIEIQGCSDEEMCTLYSMAKALIFPSLAEGFGWPVIEAQSCGCPVLTSNFAPLTEIGGEAAIYCDPRDETEMARQLKQLLDESEERRAERVASGLKNVQRFTPQHMMEGYLELYRQAITDHHSTR